MSPAWKDFERSVADVFRLLGYSVKQDLLIRGGQTDVLATATAPLRSNLIIECKYFETTTRVSIDDTENFVARVLRLRSEGIIDKGYLVTNTGFTAQAKACVYGSSLATVVYLATYDELFAQLLDAEAYLREYVRRYDESHASERLVDLWTLDARCSQRLFFMGFPGLTIKEARSSPGHEPAGSQQQTILLTDESHTTASHNTAVISCLLLPVIERLSQFLADPGARLLLLLGDYGSGKTTVLRHLMYLLASEKLSRMADTSSRLPLLLSLRDYNKVLDWDSLVITFLAKELAIDHPSAMIYRRLNEDGRLVLLLDGFDEMARLVTPAERRLTFNEICSQVGKDSKVILTGRPGYFPDNRELIEVLDPLVSRGKLSNGRRLYGYEIPGGVEIFCLQLLDRSQLARFWARAVVEHGCASGTEETLLADPHLADLARRPVLAEMIAESAPDITRLSGPLGIRQVYEAYTDKWIRREEDKGYFRLLINTDAKASFIGLLAVQMHNLGLLSLHFRQLDQHIRDYFAIDTTDTLDHFSSDIRTCSFLVRDDGGNYEFVHKSFMEYFVAREVERRHRSAFKGALERPLTDEILAFIDFSTFPQAGREILRIRATIDAMATAYVTFGFDECAKLCGEASLYGVPKLLSTAWPLYDVDPTAVQRELVESIQRTQEMQRTLEGWTDLVLEDAFVGFVLDQGPLCDIMFPSYVTQILTCSA